MTTIGLHRPPRVAALLVLVLLINPCAVSDSPTAETRSQAGFSAEFPRVPPVEPDKAVTTFQVEPGFRIELAAAEPLVHDPVAMAFDERGRLYVVEMCDYS